MPCPEIKYVRCNVFSGGTPNQNDASEFRCSPGHGVTRYCRTIAQLQLSLRSEEAAPGRNKTHKPGSSSPPHRLGRDPQDGRTQHPKKDAAKETVDACVGKKQDRTAEFDIFTVCPPWRRVKPVFAHNANQTECSPQRAAHGEGRHNLVSSNRAAAGENRSRVNLSKRSPSTVLYIDDMKSV